MCTINGMTFLAAPVCNILGVKCEFNYKITQVMKIEQIKKIQVNKILYVVMKYTSSLF